MMTTRIARFKHVAKHLLCAYALTKSCKTKRQRPTGVALARGVITPLRCGVRAGVRGGNAFLLLYFSDNAEKRRGFTPSLPLPMALPAKHFSGLNDGMYAARLNAFVVVILPAPDKPYILLWAVRGNLRLTCERCWLFVLLKSWRPSRARRSDSIQFLLLKIIRSILFNDES